MYRKLDLKTESQNILVWKGPTRTKAQLLAKPDTFCCKGSGKFAASHFRQKPKNLTFRRHFDLSFAVQQKSPHQDRSHPEPGLGICVQSSAFKRSTSTACLGPCIYHWKWHHKSHLGVLKQDCRVVRVTLLGWGALLLWFAAWLLFLSSEDGTGMVLMPTGVEGRSLPAVPGGRGWRGGSLLGGVPSASLEPGEITLWDWLFLAFLSAAPGVLTLIWGFSLRGTPSSSLSKVTNEQYPSVEEMARKDPSLDLFGIHFFPFKAKILLQPSPNQLRGVIL